MIMLSKIILQGAAMKETSGTDAKDHAQHNKESIDFPVNMQLKKGLRKHGDIRHKSKPYMHTLFFEP